MTTTERSPGLIDDHAHLADVPAIHRLIQYWADETGDVLPRSEGEIYGTLRDFMVLRDVQGGASRSSRRALCTSSGRIWPR